MFEIDTTIGKLRGNLQVAKIVNAAFGGLVEAEQRIVRADSAAFAIIAAAALDKLPEDVEEAIFDAGLMNLQRPLLEFLTRLANGGRLMEPEAARNG